MKGMSYWFWIAAGIIAGLVVFVLAYQQITGINNSAAEQRSIGQFNEIKNIADNLCMQFGGNNREYNVNLGETVEGVYTVSSKYEEYSSEELTSKILSGEYNSGKYLCIKIKDKNAECVELQCDTSMPFIGAVPEEFSLTALVNKLSGKAKTFDYSLTFERENEKVSVYLFKDRPLPAKVCAGALKLTITGTETCTVKASVVINSCNGKNWEIKDGDMTRCNGTVDKDYYTINCDAWEVVAGVNGKTFSYDLYIDGQKRDSNSVRCESPGCDESSCTAWSNQGCGLGNCDDTKMYQKRTCADNDCKETSRCVDDDQCKQSKCKMMLNNGNSQDKLDIVYVGSGYTSSDLEKFVNDVNNHKNALLSYDPFKGSSKINIYRVDDFKDLGCEYWCGGIERAICCDDSKVQSVASQCPVDQIIVLVNNNKYGGAAYLCSGIGVSYRVDGRVSVHEFGHSFGCLEDEYITDPQCTTHHCIMCAVQYPFASSPCNCLQTLTGKLNAYS